MTIEFFVELTLVKKNHSKLLTNNKIDKDDEKNIHRQKNTKNPKC